MKVSIAAWLMVALLISLAFLYGCAAPHPSQWTPYDPSAEWECQDLAWNTSNGQTNGGRVYRDCMTLKGFKAQRVWAR